MESLISLIEDRYKITLSREEIHIISKLVPTFKKMPQESIDDLLKRIIVQAGHAIVQKRKTMQARLDPGNTFDLREYQIGMINSTELAYNASDEYASNLPPDTDAPIKRTEPTKNIEIGKIFGTRTPFELQMIFNPSAAYLHNYIIFDSKYRLGASTNRTSFSEIKFGYSPTTSFGEGIINSVGKIRDIVSMRIYRPVIPSVDALFLTDAKRISIAIEEFRAQSIILSNGRHVHFICTYDLNTLDTSLLNIIIEDFNDGIFRFAKPIQSFETLTMTIGNPDTKVTFLRDRYTVTFTYGATTIVTCDAAHEVPAAGSVYVTITGFTTDAPVADASIISSINDTQPYAASYVSATQLELPFNTTTITPTVGLTAELFVESRRIIVPMEITYLRSN